MELQNLRCALNHATVNPSRVAVCSIFVPSILGSRIDSSFLASNVVYVVVIASI